MSSWRAHLRLLLTSTRDDGRGSIATPVQLDILSRKPCFKSLKPETSSSCTADKGHSQIMRCFKGFGLPVKGNAIGCTCVKAWLASLAFLLLPQCLLLVDNLQCACTGSLLPAQHSLPYSMAAASENFARWVEANGCFMHPSLSLFHILPSGDRGVVAQARIKKGEELINVCLDACIHFPSDEEWAQHQASPHMHCYYSIPEMNNTDAKAVLTPAGWESTTG